MNRLCANAGPHLGSRILGVDPGLQITGYAVVEAGPRGPVVCEAGVIRSSYRHSSADLAPRVRSVYTGIVEVIDQFQPQAVVVEQLYAHYAHPRTAILMAHARGVIFLAAAEKLQCHEHQEDDHRPRSRFERADASHHAARIGPGDFT
jgi:crossover junction endodeoxyribonuclease RuvC